MTAKMVLVKDSSDPMPGAKSCVSYFLNLLNEQFSRSFEPPKSIAFLTGSINKKQ